MDYFVSTSLSKLERMIEKEKDAAIRQKLLVVWHKKGEQWTRIAAERNNIRKYISSKL